MTTEERSAPAQERLASEVPARRDARAEEEILTAVAGAASLALMLDYDGTLVAFHPRPHQARPDGALLALLGELSSVPELSVHVVTGRSRQDIVRWLGHLPIGLHAEHGLWSRWPGAAHGSLNAAPPVDWIEQLHPALVRLAGDLPGAMVERKQSSVAFHHRRADPVAARETIATVRLVATAFPGVEILLGHEVVELRWRGVHKGLAVGAIRARLAGALPIAVGDDTTDEDMFAALPAEGVAVRVGDGASRARFRLAGPASVRGLLAALLDLRSRSRTPPRHGARRG
jgi:trehalose 6-phosphate synthase/phosphatase